MAVDSQPPLSIPLCPNQVGNEYRGGGSGCGCRGSARLRTGIGGHERNLDGAVSSSLAVRCDGVGALEQDDRCNIIGIHGRQGRRGNHIAINHVDRARGGIGGVRHPDQWGGGRSGGSRLRSCAKASAQEYEIGRASCRERGEISVGAGSLKKKKKENRV